MTNSYPPESGGVRLRSFLAESAIYGLGSVADKLIGFLLLPITTLLLAPEDFGVLNVFGATTSLAYLLASLGQHQVVPIVHAQASNEEERRGVFGTAAALGVAMALLLIAVLTAFGASFGPVVFAGPTDDAAWKLIYVVGLFTLFDVLRKLAQARLRLAERPRTFVAINLVSTVVIRAAALGLVWAGFGALGWGIGETAAIALSVAVLWPLAFGRFRLPVDRGLATTMIPLGLALAPSLLAHWVMMGADRYVMLASLADARRQIGLFAIGERISSVMQLVNFAFVLGWQRFAFENLVRLDGPKRFSHGLTVYAAVGGYIAFSLALLGGDLTRLMTPASYNAGVVVIPTLTLAGFFGGFAELVSARLQQANLGVRLSAATWIAAGVQAGLLFWAIPRYGIQGAAMASLAGQAVKLVLICALVQASARVPFETRRLLQLALAFVVVYGIGWWSPGFGPSGQFLWRLAVVGATPFLILGAGFLAPDEKERILAGLRRMIRFRTRRSFDVSEHGPENRP